MKPQPCFIYQTNDDWETPQGPKISELEQLKLVPHIEQLCNISKYRGITFYVLLLRFYILNSLEQERNLLFLDRLLAVHNE